MAYRSAWIEQNLKKSAKKDKRFWVSKGDFFKIPFGGVWGSAPRPYSSFFIPHYFSTLCARQQAAFHAA
ncbi:MAG: hypothetical protein IJW40_12245, partial [Clostridia bacterium]|nr:hypothetical protein [Clostridia bacterium]